MLQLHTFSVCQIKNNALSVMICSHRLLTWLDASTVYAQLGLAATADKFIGDAYDF